MTKLISRNPILRFKAGRKIVKADGGTSLFEFGSKDFGGIKVNKNGNRYYTIGDNNIFENGEIWNTKTGRKIGINNAIAREYIHPLWTPELIKADRAAKKTPDTTVTVELAEKNNKVNLGRAVANRNKTNIRGTVTPVVKPTPTLFMGEGIQQGWRGTVGKAPELTDLLKLQLINTGKFTDNDFATAGALQTALNNYFGGTVGSISVDNKWGSLSQKALDTVLAATKDPGTYMNLSLSLDLPNLDGTKTRTNIHGRYNITGLLSNKMTNPENIPTINLNNASPAITPQVSNVNLNRAQTRDLMRAHNLNPYNYSGAQRKALRNFYSTGNYDSNLLSGIISKDYKWLKKGGLISRNPVKQFKSKFLKGGSLTSLKTGGNIPKFQTPWKAMDWNLAENENKTLEFGRKAQEHFINNERKNDAKRELRTKALNRANRGVSAPFNDNTAKLQEALWNVGAFNGLKDRRGRNVVFDTAVDGMRGDVTNQAIENAKRAGYTVDINTGRVGKNISVTPNSDKVQSPQSTSNTKPKVEPKKDNNSNNNSNNNLSYTFLQRLGNKLSKLTGLESLYTDSPNRNGQAIVDHMVNTGYPNNYVIADKTNNRIYLMNGPDTLRVEEASSGLNVGDGYDILNHRTGRYYSTLPRTSGAGIYNLRIRGRQPAYYNEQMADLYDGNIRSAMAFHAPAGAARAAVFNNSNDEDNRVSYGCWSGKCGVVLDMIDKKQITNNTPWFSIPELSGNYIRENNGELETVYGNAPETYTVNGKTYNFRYNKQKFK